MVVELDRLFQLQQSDVILCDVPHRELLVDDHLLDLVSNLLSVPVLLRVETHDGGQGTHAAGKRTNIVMGSETSPGNTFCIIGAFLENPSLSGEFSPRTASNVFADLWHILCSFTPSFIDDYCKAFYWKTVYFDPVIHKFVLTDTFCFMKILQWFHNGLVSNRGPLPGSKMPQFSKAYL